MSDFDEPPVDEIEPEPEAEPVSLDEDERARIAEDLEAQPDEQKTLLLPSGLILPVRLPTIRIMARHRMLPMTLTNGVYCKTKLAKPGSGASRDPDEAQRAQWEILRWATFGVAGLGGLSPSDWPVLWALSSGSLETETAAMWDEYADSQLPTLVTFTGSVSRLLGLERYLVGYDIESALAVYKMAHALTLAGVDFNKEATANDKRNPEYAGVGGQDSPFDFADHFRK